jgi:hypothetical protein
MSGETLLFPTVIRALAATHEARDCTQAVIVAYETGFVRPG